MTPLETQLRRFGYHYTGEAKLVRVGQETCEMVDGGAVAAYEDEE